MGKTLAVFVIVWQLLWQLSVEEIKLWNSTVVCPCISYRHDVDYDCLLDKIQKEGPIDFACFGLIRAMKSVSFQFLDLGQPVCKTDNYADSDTKQPANEGGMEKLTGEVCERMKWKFTVVYNDKHFFDTLAANLARSNVEPLECLFVLTFLLGNVGISRTSSCTDLKQSDIYDAKSSFLHFRYTNGTFSCLDKKWGANWYVFNSVEGSIPIAHSSSPSVPIMDEKNLGAFLLGTQLNDTFTTIMKLRCPTKIQRHENILMHYDSVYFLSVFSASFTVSDSDDPVHWVPDLSLQHLRVYHDSSISFSLRWKCPMHWKQTPGSFQIVCDFFYLSQNIKSGCAECLNSQLDNNCQMCPMLSTENYEIVGPVAVLVTPWNQPNVTFEVQTNFNNNIYPNGSIRVLTSEQEKIHLFSYNYFTGNFFGYLAEEGEDFNMLYYPYLKQSIILHGPSDSPMMITPAEVSDLAACCKIRARSEEGKLSTWSHQRSFILKRNVQPLRVQLGYYEMRPGKGVHGRFGFFRHFLMEYNVGEKEISYHAAMSSPPTPETLELADISLMHLYVACYRKDCYGPWSKLSCAESNPTLDPGPECDRWPWRGNRLLEYYVGVRVGCYHWIFNKWYIFIRDEQTEQYQLASSDGGTGDLNWDQIGWKLLLEPVVEIPTTLKCPPLHSFLLWSSMTHNGTVKVHTVFLNSSTGEPLGSVQNLAHEKLCACSEIPVVTVPIIEVIYRNLAEPDSLQLAVLCGNTVCGNSFTKELKTEQSEILHQFLKSPNAAIYWFALHQNHIYFMVRDSKHLFIDDIGNSSSDHKLTAERAVETWDRVVIANYLTIPGSWLYYHCVYVPKGEEFLPSPPKECVTPLIHENIRFMITSTHAGHLTLRTKWSNDEKCALFAKPAVIYKIQYGTVLGSMALNASSLLYCKNSDAFLRADIEMNCMEVLMKPTRETSNTYVIGNFAAGKPIFFQVTALMDFEVKTSGHWFSGLKLSTEKRMFHTKYIPHKSSLNLVLSVSVPLVILSLLLLIVFCSVYNRHLYMYRTLSRLHAKDIKCDKKLGEGNFGEVWRARKGSQIVVVKTLKESATDREEKEFREEALLLSKFHSDFIVKAIGICLQSRPIMLALEFADGGALDSYLKRSQVRSIIDISDLLLITRDALSGCLYLESEGYIHRDISARNCLVLLISERSWKPKNVKISDFGLAKDIGKESVYRSKNPDAEILPVAWTPPEAFGGKFSPKSDVWAFGVLMWEVFSFAATPYGNCSLGGSHRCPLSTLTHHVIEYKVCVEQLTLADMQVPCTAAFCSALKKIFTLCWNYNLEDRPSFKQLQNFLKGAQSEIMKIHIPDFTATTDIANTKLSVSCAPKKASITCSPVYGESSQVATNISDHPGMQVAYKIGNTDEVDNGTVCSLQKSQDPDSIVDQEAMELTEVESPNKKMIPIKDYPAKTTACEVGIPASPVGDQIQIIAPGKLYGERIPETKTMLS